MRYLDRKLALVLALLLFAPGAVGQETTQWAEIEGWSVRVDNTVGYGCYIHARYESGTSLRVGYDPQAGKVYLMLGNPAWRSLEDGAEYELVLQFDDLTPWRVGATAVPVGARGALAFELSEQGFIRQFMERHVLTISHGRSEIDRLNLSGSLEAVQEMVRCQRQIDQAQRPDGEEGRESPDSRKESLSPAPSRDPFF